MMTIQPRSLVLILALMGTASQSLMANTTKEIYRWTDPKGQQHFSTIPPTNIPLDKIETVYGETPRSVLKELQAQNQNNAQQQANNTQTQQPAQTDYSGLDEKYAKQLRKLNEERKEMCAKAKSNKESLLNSPRVVMLDVNGESSTLNDDQRLEQLKIADQEINQFCQ